MELCSVWFQQDGATALTAQLSLNIPWDMFPQHVIARGSDVQWPAHPPDPPACYYFLLG